MKLWRTGTRIRTLKMAHGKDHSVREPSHCDQTEAKHLRVQPMRDLDLMIANGWGDLRQWKMPKDWRTTKPKEKNNGH